MHSVTEHATGSGKTGGYEATHVGSACRTKNCEHTRMLGPDGSKRVVQTKKQGAVGLQGHGTPWPCRCRRCPFLTRLSSQFSCGRPEWPDCTVSPGAVGALELNGKISQVSKSGNQVYFCRALYRLAPSGQSR